MLGHLELLRKDNTKVVPMSIFLAGKNLNRTIFK